MQKSNSSAKKQRVEQKGNLGFKVQEQNPQEAQVAEGTFYRPKLSIRAAPNNGLCPSPRKKKAAGLRDGRRASAP